MDADVARALFFNGATLVLLDTPAGTEVGLDYQLWTVTARFSGVKMIPPGVHCLFYSAVSPHGAVGPRYFQVLELQSRQVVVQRWSRETETYVDVATAFGPTDGVNFDLRTLDPQLAPYPYGDAAKIWNELSRHVRPEHVRALLPPGGRYTPVPDAVAAPDEAPADPKAIAPTATALRFTPFDLRRSFPPDATPAEVTRYSLDKSWLLSHVVLQRWQPALLDRWLPPIRLLIGVVATLVLGELQMAFILFAVGHAFEAFDAWKSLVTLFTSCEEALLSHPDLFSEFALLMHPDVFRHQLTQVPPELFPDSLSRDNFVLGSTRLFWRNVRSTQCRPAVTAAAAKLVAAVEAKFSVTIRRKAGEADGHAEDTEDDEDDEDAPVVVQVETAT